MRAVTGPLPGHDSPFAGVLFAGKHTKREELEMNNAQSYGTFQPLSIPTAWYSSGGTTLLDVPKPQSGSSSSARLVTVRALLARIGNRASRRMHEIAPPPRTIHESLGLKPWSH
jgi:hypothetical protein